MPPGQVLDAQRHNRPHRLFIQTGADAGSVAAQDVFLQPAGVFFGNGDIAQRSEPGGHPVDGLLLPNPAVDQFAGISYALGGSGGQLHFGALPGDGHQLLQRQTVYPEHYLFHLQTSAIYGYHISSGQYPIAILQASPKQDIYMDH